MQLCAHEKIDSSRRRTSVDKKKCINYAQYLFPPLSFLHFFFFFSISNTYLILSLRILARATLGYSRFTYKRYRVLSYKCACVCMCVCVCDCTYVVCTYLCRCLRMRARIICISVSIIYIIYVRVCVCIHVFMYVYLLFFI